MTTALAVMMIAAAAAAAASPKPTPSAGAPAATTTSPAAPAPCAAPERHEFDFWIGEWDVTGANGKRAGGNVIKAIMGGCVLEENWTGARGNRGTSLNAWSPHDRKWHQTWMDDSGLVLLLTGGLRDGAMVMEGEAVGAQGEPNLNRITWTRLPNDEVRQLWQVSTDRGKTWTTSFDGHYRRVR